MFQTNFSFYGLFIILAIICGLVIVYMNLKFLKFKKEETIGLLLYIALGCIFGAKYYTYFVNYQKYNGFFNFIRVGLSSYGAVIGILFMLLLFSKQYKKNFKDLLCILLPAIPFMYAVGKIGCFFAGCCYGIEYNGFLNVTYNYSAIAPKGMSLFPIQLLESIVFLIIFLYVNQRMTQKIQAKINKSVEERLPYTRKYDFYVDEYIGREECGKTVRLFNQQSLLSETLNEIFKKVSKLLSRQTILEARMNQWAEGINVLISGMIYLLLGIMALKRVISVGSICLYAGCITNFLWHFQKWNQQVSLLKMNTKYVKQYLDFMDIKNKKYEGTLPVEKRDDDKFMIEFENVSFHYPGSEKNVLENFSIRFNIGERLAVVGRNGSGKTTFIKLLCRLYDPTEGRILLNEIDIKKYDYKEYLSLFSVVFQDFQIPAFTLGQAVAASQEYDEEHVNDAVKKAGLSSLAARMPYGNETYLTKEFDKTGVNISGGEAQKLAIARALYHDTPFVILDEPTAALDPIAEYEVYAKFDELIGTKTAVYISHRLSSCQFCNDILVIDDGKAVQRGSHEKLIDEEGLYAKLWKTQAKYYQKTQ